MCVYVCLCVCVCVCACVCIFMCVLCAYIFLFYFVVKNMIIYYEQNRLLLCKILKSMVYKHRNSGKSKRQTANQSQYNCSIHLNQVNAE